MALITGTSGTDILVGTAADDILRPLGTTVRYSQEVLQGLDGADVYDLQRSGTASIYNFLIDDQGTDGAMDGIINRSRNPAFPKRWPQVQRSLELCKMSLNHRPDISCW
mgnify:CR=1 FL=1